MPFFDFVPLRSCETPTRGQSWCPALRRPVGRCPVFACERGKPEGWTPTSVVLSFRRGLPLLRVTARGLLSVKCGTSSRARACSDEPGEPRDTDGRDGHHLPERLHAEFHPDRYHDFQLVMLNCEEWQFHMSEGYLTFPAASGESGRRSEISASRFFVRRICFFVRRIQANRPTGHCRPGSTVSPEVARQRFGCGLRLCSLRPATEGTLPPDEVRRTASSRSRNPIPITEPAWSQFPGTWRWHCYQPL